MNSDGKINRHKVLLNLFNKITKAGQLNVKIQGKMNFITCDRIRFLYMNPIIDQHKIHKLI